MRKLYFLCSALLLMCGAHSQSVSLSDLVSYTAYSPSHFNSFISKRGYRMAGYGSNTDGGTSYTWHDKKAKEDPVEKMIFKCDKEDMATIAFQTTSANEATALREQLNKEGYRFAAGAKAEVYQKNNITIQPLQKADGDKTVYSFSIERKALPKEKDIRFAEDFMQLSSHEYLATVFGEENVKRDQFYFTEKEVNRCSVLFPNSSKQVIFIWNDEDNMRDLAFVIIGGQLQAQSSLSYHKQIEQNIWQSRQGIYSGMSLNELQRLNGNSFNLWGWQSEQPGVVARKNTGTVDFTQLSVVLNCMDCDANSDVVKNELLNSDVISREGRRVYVSTIIVLPKKSK